jgi:hypothetical protein
VLARLLPVLQQHYEPFVTAQPERSSRARLSPVKSLGKDIIGRVSKDAATTIEKFKASVSEYPINHSFSVSKGVIKITQAPGTIGENLIRIDLGCAQVKLLTSNDGHSV